MRQLTLGVRLKERATFASFHAVGNAELVLHLQALAEGRVRGAVWCAGPPASGKSHLLQAVCAHAVAPRRAGYFPIAELLALGPGALDGAGALDIVCIDDIDRCAGLDAWERALFALYREIDERRGSFIAAAAAPAAAQPWGLADLRSRLAASLTFATHPLDDEQQLAALTKRAAARGLELPDETGRYLQRRFPRDMATLAHLLDTLDDASLVAQRRLTVPFIRAVLESERR
jgi:DnaA-homolog protein